MDWQTFCEKVSKITRMTKPKSNLKIEEDKITFNLNNEDYTYTLEDFNNLKEKSSNYTFQPFSINNNYKYESVIELVDDSRRLLMIDIESKFSELDIIDNELELTYKIEGLSDEMIYNIIENYNINKTSLRLMSSFYIERKFESLKRKNLMGLILISLRMPYAVKITSKTMKTEEQFQKYTKSFLFNLSYNFDLVFKNVTKIEEIFPERNILVRRKRHEYKEITAPKLIYKQELVEQYYMALASTDPFVKFIGFYHIMEHFYDDVYNEDMFENIQNMIQHPGFSSKRKKDIAKLVDLIKKKTRQNKEEFQGSELEALELTLKKYIDINDLVNELEENDDSIINYYANHQISFSNGDSVDLKDITNDKIYKKLAARIYKTRNALVHSKSNEGRTNERGMYKPFKDSQELYKEIALMRYIAETIIINSASSI